tara:strand:+ start:1150 stop:1752 length:603 start_codon:yes stop_codon:yes gene_type:complete
MVKTLTNTTSPETFVDAKSLDDLLQQFSNSIFKPGNSIGNITTSYIITENNMSIDKKRDIRLIIAEILKTINPIHQVKYSLLDIERIKVEENLFKERQYSVVFLIHEVAKFSTRKVLLQYKVLSTGDVQLQSIRTLQSENDLSNTIKPYDVDNNFLNSKALKIGASDPDEEKKFSTPYSNFDNFTIFQNTQSYNSQYESI